MAGGGAWSPASVSWSRRLLPQCLFQRDWNLRPSPTLDFSHPVLVIMEKSDHEREAKRGGEVDTVVAPPLFPVSHTYLAQLPIAVMSNDSANLRTGSVFTVKACRYTVHSANRRRPPPSEPPTLLLHFVFLRHNPKTEFYHNIFLWLLRVVRLFIIYFWWNGASDDWPEITGVKSPLDAAVLVGLPHLLIFYIRKKKSKLYVQLFKTINSFQHSITSAGFFFFLEMTVLTVSNVSSNWHDNQSNKLFKKHKSNTTSSSTLEREVTIYAAFLPSFIVSSFLPSFLSSCHVPLSLLPINAQYFMHLLFNAVKGIMLNIVLILCWGVAMDENSRGKGSVCLEASEKTEGDVRLKVISVSQ